MSTLVSAPAFAPSKSYAEDMILRQRRLPFQTACGAGYRIEVLETQCIWMLWVRVFNEVRFLKFYILSFDSVSQELLGRRSTEQRLLVPLYTHTHTHTHTHSKNTQQKAHY